VDQIVAQVRSGRADAVGLPRVAASGSSSSSKIVDDLHSIQDLLERLEDKLVSEPSILANLGEELQNLDLGMQMLRAVAACLATPGADPEQGVRLDNLRVACAHALGRAEMPGA
jgi:hypothetical protein